MTSPVTHVDHKPLVRRFVEDVWNEGNIAAAAEYFAADFVDHNPAGPGPSTGVEGAKQVFTMYRNAFPDLKLTIHDMISEGDRVAWRWSSHGTHQGEFMGFPASGKAATVTGIEVYRIIDGKIAERWGSFDQLGLLEQLGIPLSLNLL